MLTTTFLTQIKIYINSGNSVFQYLGSTVVKELRGTESTKKSIQKLKKSSSAEDKEKINPDITLAISFRGVKFLNPSNQVGFY